MPVAAHPSRSASRVERRQPAAGRAGRQRTSRPPETEGTRARLVTAAAAEFAAHGFAGGNVDRIARAARVNKAMIYYHFHSKAALYREILGDMFRAVCARVRVVADSAGDAGREDPRLHRRHCGRGPGAATFPAHLVP